MSTVGNQQADDAELLNDQARIRNFDALLKDISSLDDKKRQLWKEIYENAIEDRRNAYMMYTKLVRIVGDKSTEHAVHGKAIASYLERMARSTDHFIKLAEMISREQGPKDDGPIDPNQIYDKIRSS